MNRLEYERQRRLAGRCFCGYARDIILLITFENIAVVCISVEGVNQSKELASSL